MFNSLKKIFDQTEKTHQNNTNNLHLLSGLMIEAANIDGHVDQNEVHKISNVLTDIFHEEPSAVETEIKKCLDELGEHKSLHSFTSQINQSFTNEKKIILIEVLWEIILEDGKTHDFESNLIRRLAGLLYLSDIQCGNAKKRALKKSQSPK